MRAIDHSVEGNYYPMDMAGDISKHGTMRQLLSLVSRSLSWHQRNISEPDGNRESSNWIGCVFRICDKDPMVGDSPNAQTCTKHWKVTSLPSIMSNPCQRATQKFICNFLHFPLFFWLSDAASLATSVNLLRRQKMPQPSALLARGRLRNTES